MKNSLAGRDFLDSKIKIVSLVGPTASGKTELAVRLAECFDGEIISADSMQIYKGMDIATAKPDKAEMRGVPHHLLDFLPPDEDYSVARFVSDAKECIKSISGRGRLPFVVGGTGLYVDSLLNNISFSEQKRDEAFCDSLWEIFNKGGADELLIMLGEFDPDSAQRLGKEKNPKRIIRAIEFYHSSGITITEQNRRSRSEEPPYDAIKLGITFCDRQKLYDRINKRVDLMMSRGLLEEAKNVLSSQLSFTAVKAIGYKELLPYIKGDASLEDCVESLKRETRRYAKRQITWFKRDGQINWLYADSSDGDGLFEHAAGIIEKGLMYG